MIDKKRITMVFLCLRQGFGSLQSMFFQVSLCFVIDQFSTIIFLCFVFYHFYLFIKKSIVKADYISKLQIKNNVQVAKY